MDCLKIGIVGPGAIGMLFGAYLSEQGHSVTFYVKKNENKQLYIHTLDRGTREIDCKMTDEIEVLRNMDLVIIAVKYHHLSSVKEALDCLPKELPLLFIQNGLLHLTYIELLKQETILLGSVLHGAAKENTFTVSHTGKGVTTIGQWKGNWLLLEEFLKSGTSSFPLQLTSHIEHILFKKALLNCLINPLTAIARVPNGELLHNPSYHTIMKNIYKELLAAFPEWQSDLPWFEVEELCRNTASNRSSMLKDLENGRFMELDTIVGAVRERALERGKELPILQTFYLLLSEMNKVGDSHY